MDEKSKWNSNHLWDEEIIILKSILNKTPLQETTKWGGIVYVYNNKNVLGIGGFKNHLAIWFFNGAFLEDKYNLLVASSENTKALRQWRLRHKNEINEKILLQYIQEAIANVENGILLKPSKAKEISSDFLNQELKKDTILEKAFYKFTNYKQREFLEYIETAKQEKTKISRFEKIKPMIMSGIGLNDKYKK